MALASERPKQAGKRSVLVNERTLPDTNFDEKWTRIFVPDTTKDQLLGMAVLLLTLRPRLSRTASTLHGLIVLLGPPGTGKTTLGVGLANEAAKVLRDNRKGPAGRSRVHVKYAEVDPHRLPSELLGRTQQAVTNLLTEEIPGLADEGAPTIVFLDEVEAFAVSRSRSSLETNPVDVHRATDAVLSGIDRLAEEYPHLLFIATSNFVSGIDDAFLSRADLVTHLEVPDLELGTRIMVDTLEEYGEAYPRIRDLATTGIAERVAKEALGLDGRQLRKLPVMALASDLRMVGDPNLLTEAALLAAARLVRAGQARLSPTMVDGKR